MNVQREGLIPGQFQYPTDTVRRCVSNFFRERPDASFHGCQRRAITLTCEDQSSACGCLDMDECTDGVDSPLTV